MTDLSPGLIDALAQHVAALDAERAVRATITRYMALWRCPRTPATAVVAGLFTPDAVWEGIGPQYAQSSAASKARPRSSRCWAATCRPIRTSRRTCTS